MSIDQVFSHIKWVQWIRENLQVEIEFPIIADDRGLLAERLGMIHEHTGPNTVRSVFIVDGEARIRLILTYPAEVGRNMDEILRAVKALQVADENKVALPANWPNNELVGDEAIIPPATDIKTADERQGQDGYYDWWFGHKKI